MKKLKDWSQSPYTKKIRITEEDLKFLKKTRKGRKSTAGLLHDIIKAYKKT